MKRSIISEVSTQDYAKCPVKITIEIIGGKWKPAILYLIQNEITRFGEMHKTLLGISKRMLTTHLRELEADGVINRKVFAEVPPKVIYSLTDLGKTVIPVLTAMANWGEKYLSRNVNHK
jgi:DNA-binding HxlR family transcriptional regulator